MKYTYFWSKKYIQYSTLLDWFIAITFCRGGSRAAATFKMERFAIIVNSFQPFTIITNHSILDVAAVLDPPLLLDNEINEKLNFENTCINYLKKTNKQSNPVSTIANSSGQKEKEIWINAFIYSNFKYCPLIIHISNQKCLKKIEKIKERYLIVITKYTSWELFAVIQNF